MNLFRTGAAAVNTLVRPLVSSSVGDKLLGRWGRGRPGLVRLDGAERTGHAVTDRGDQGQVTVSVHLTPA